MARRKQPTLDWRLDAQDAEAVPNARIALALIRFARRVPHAGSAVDPDEIGRALAPAIATEPALWRATLRAHRLARRSPDRNWADDEETIEDNAPLDRDTFDIIGHGLLRGDAVFDKLMSRIEERLDEFTASVKHSADANVATLAGLLSLNAAEAAFLLLATAHLHGVVSRGVHRFVSTPTRALKAAEVLGGGARSGAARVLQATGPLAMSGLFDNLAGDGSGLDLEDRLRLTALGERLLGRPFADAGAMSEVVLRPLPPAPVPALSWPHLARESALLATTLRQGLDTRRAGVNILVHGVPGTGKTEFVRQLVADVGGAGFSVAHADDDGDEATRHERLRALRLCQTFASHDARSVLVLDEAEDIFTGHYNHPLARLFRRTGESKAWMNQLLETNEHPVVWISNGVAHLDPAYLRRFTFCLEFPESPLHVRRQVAESHLRPLGCSDAFIDAVASTSGLTPALLSNAASFATLCAQGAASPDEAVQASLSQHAKASGRPELLLTRPSETSFDVRYLNVRGSATPERVMAALGQPGTAAALMFSGPPGTGKTRFAAELARTLGRRLVVKTASDINGMYYGESEGNVARMFRDCDPADELLFLDEAEVLLGARESSQQRADRAVTAEFLRWLDAFKGIFICATNHADAFDAALVRRFTFRLEFLPLDENQRVDLFAQQALRWTPEAGPRPPVSDGSLRTLRGLEGLTAGDFANVARRMRLLALSDEGDWLRELGEEFAHKPGAAVRRPIGFR